MPLAVGQLLQGRYRILRLLGQGGMGAVYLAEDTRLGRQCAVKENIPDPTAAPQVLAQLRQQFQAEARILAALDHPNLPKVYDFFTDGGSEYIVMEYIEGDTLATLSQRQGGPLPERPVLIWADQVLDALEELHGQQPRPIIHRDIKPANIILTAKGRIKLVDFGLVKLLDPNDPRTATVMKGMGTPEYAPLEQYASGAGHTDARSDIYSIAEFRAALAAARAGLGLSIPPASPPAPAAMRCPSCGQAYAVGEIYCQNCAAVLAGERACPHCGASAPSGALYCPGCGRVIASSVTPCPQCGHANAPVEVYCQGCSRPLGRDGVCRACGQGLPQHARYCPACGSHV